MINTSLLKNKNFMLLIIGKFVSLLGTNVQSFALSLYVLDLTGSATKFASILIIGMIPELLLSPIAGVVVDWFPKKKLIVLSDLISGVTLVSIFFITKFQAFNLTYIYIVVIVLACTSTIFNPAASVMIPLSVKKDNLVKANSMSTVVMNFTELIAPIIAGIAYGFFGIGFIIAFNGVSFIVSAISEGFIQLTESIEKRHSEQGIMKAVERDFKEGLQFVWGNYQLRMILIMAFTVNFFFNPIVSVGIPYMIKEIYGFSNWQFGFLESTIIIGTMGGTIAINVIVKKVKDMHLFQYGLMLTGIMIVLLGVITIPIILKLTQVFILRFTLMIVIGFLLSMSVTVVNIAIITILQKVVPIHLMGRVRSVQTMLGMGLIPLGQGVFGIVVDQMPFYIPVIISGFIMAGVAMSSIKDKGQKQVLLEEM